MFYLATHKLHNNVSHPLLMSRVYTAKRDSKLETYLTSSHVSFSQISYMISILLGHCEVAFPYISDTGVHIPESCIFSQLLNIASMLIALTVVVRYKQVEQQCRDNMLACANRVFALNKSAFIIGLLSTAGLSIVANFQELQLFTVHMIGAFSAFGFGLIYCAAQTRLSYYMYPIVHSGLLLARCRLALTFVLAITFSISTVFGPISIKYFHGTDTTNWRPNDGGYVFHVISSVSEWISAMSLDLFILSFAHEFKFMSISSPKFFMISTVAAPEEDDSDTSSQGVVNIISHDNFMSSQSRSPGIQTPRLTRAAR